MKNFRYFNNIVLDQILSPRKGETKLGEKITVPPKDLSDLASFLKQTEASFVIYGIKEFAGVKANFGKTGIRHSWEVFLSSFLNIQNNKHLKGSKILVLGCLDYSVFEEEILNNNPDNIEELKRLYEIVNEIDKDVTYLNALIHKSGKTPVVIGGGHNNSYGNIKGLALAKGNAVNVINFDAHTDFRALEGRHSGNGFSYAFHEGFLKNYCAFGVQENYLNKWMLKQFKEHYNALKIFTFDEMKVRFEKDFLTAMNNAFKGIKNTHYGIEVDVDAIENVASSAMSPSGFSTTEARQFVYLMGSHPNAKYLHLCEGSPDMNVIPENMLGKLLSYLTTDFIKAQIASVK
ncbi:MAG TPA: formimidoylglutamase [Flavobacterium sp.]|nr:formimidoylglutamase [Flavobacterium sp.]